VDLADLVLDLLLLVTEVVLVVGEGLWNGEGGERDGSSHRSGAGEGAHR
jgi:hypothetical protein